MTVKHVRSTPEESVRIESQMRQVQRREVRKARKVGMAARGK